VEDRKMRITASAVGSIAKMKQSTVWKKSRNDPIQHLQRHSGAPISMLDIKLSLWNTPG
jgi:hypothetical protein